MDQIDLLYSEYKIASERIEDYQRSHFRYYSGLVLLIVALFTFYFEDGFRAMGLQLIPYPVLIILLLIYYHYHRTLIVQGYRQALEIKINELVRKEILLFHGISDKYIINPKTNLSIPLFTLLNIAIVSILIYACNSSHSINVHLIIQCFLMVIISLLFAYSTFIIKSKISIEVKENLMKNYPR